MVKPQAKITDVKYNLLFTGRISRQSPRVYPIFAIGSITKVFTTILLADAVQEGLIKLDDPVDKYLPSIIKVPQYNGHRITFEDT